MRKIEGAIMPEPRFEIGQQVHIAQNHCAHCRELENELKHPVIVKAVIPYGDESTYRVQDAVGLHYESPPLVALTLDFSTLTL